MNTTRLLQGLGIPALALLIYSILLLRLPLFNELGYEFSVAIALVVPILSWYIVRHHLRNSIRASAVVTQFRILVLLCVPLTAATFNLVLVKNCSYWEGVAFYFLIPVITSVWIQGLIFFCRACFKKPLLWYIVILLLGFGYSLYLGYATPQIYSYNFVYGFFGGFSYDETMSISLPLLLFRLLTLYCGLALLGIGGMFTKRRSVPSPPTRMLNIVLIALPLIAAWIFRTTLGFESPAGFIREELGSAYVTEHFRIYYPSTSFSEDEVRYVAAMNEFRLSQVEKTLRMEFRGTIESYIYADADAKRRYIGTGNTNIAKPWRKEIHLNKESWESTLKHEIAHVVAGEFGMPVIRAHYNIGLVEGLAMAVDPEFGNKSLHEYAAAMLKFGIIRDPARLVRPAGFASQSSSVSYVMMGSFITFLIDRYGVPRFRELYGGTSVERAYGIPYERLAEEWVRLLGEIEVPEAWRRHVDFFFRRPSIFAKECAHAIANANEEGYRKLRNNAPAGAMDEFSRGLAMSWNSDSFSGLVRAAYTAGRYDSLVALIDAQTQDSLRRTSFVNLFLLYGDALWLRNDYTAARNVYTELCDYDLSERLNESAELRLMILRDTMLRTKLSAVITGSIADSLAVRMLDTVGNDSTRPLVRYLKGKILMRSKQYRRAIDELAAVRFQACS
jgi:hypothetical protein